MDPMDSWNKNTREIKANNYLLLDAIFPFHTRSICDKKKREFYYAFWRFDFVTLFLLQKSRAKFDENPRQKTNSRPKRPWIRNWRKSFNLLSPNSKPTFFFAGDDLHLNWSFSYLFFFFLPFFQIIQIEYNLRGFRVGKAVELLYYSSSSSFGYSIEKKKKK